MASSELSRILNNANANLYPEPSLTTMTVPSMHRVQDMSFSSTLSTLGPWHQVNPQYWTKRNVLEWIDFHMEESQCDASLLSLESCSMEGSLLCTLSQDSLTSMFGPQLGHTLHHNLEALKTKHADDLMQNLNLSETYDLLGDFLLGIPQGLLDTVVVQNLPEKKETDFGFYGEYKPQLTPGSDNGYDSYSESQQSSSTGSFQMPSSPESSLSDSDPEYYPLPSKSFVKQEMTEKKKRGRPPKISRGSDNYMENKKSKHAPRGTHLWEFIRDILVHPEQNPGLMKWEDRRDGVFKFLKSEAVAQLWGQKKKNSSMTYEKLSRAMRYYYKREILERVDGRRLVYKFGKNSSGWKLEEVRL